MRTADVMVVGAGASGLMIARKLSQEGLNVVILEARDRVGGRILTIEDPAFTVPLEAGAEFIHGNLPVTINLLKEAGLHYRASSGEAWRFFSGLLQQDTDFMEKDELVTNKLDELKQDITVARFLETNFREDKYAVLKQEIKGFVEGYDSGDTNRASAFALRTEWESNDEDQHRVDGGYIQLIRYLEKECREKDCSIHTSSIVKQVIWGESKVEVTTDDHKRYTAKKIIITVPLGVLQAADRSQAAISFAPALPKHQQAWKLLGFGNVIKVLLLFKNPFWNDPRLADGKDLKSMGWLFSGEPIPTWWSQFPDDSPLLTGWLAGPGAGTHKETDEAEILDKALGSLCKIFTLTKEQLLGEIIYSKVFNWVADPFTLGAYSYLTPETPAARKQLGMPVENTIFFAGEALYDGPEVGTVEGALANGLEVSALVLRGFAAGNHL